VKQRNEEAEGYWRAHVRAQGSEGVSVRAYCRRERLGESKFHWWRRELARRGAQGTPVGFAAVEVIEGTAEREGGGDPVARPADRVDVAAMPAPTIRCEEPAIANEPAIRHERAGTMIEAPPAGIEVRLAGNRGVRVARGFDEAAFVRVVALLEGGAPC
jgi:hypothetical protein